MSQPLFILIHGFTGNPNEVLPLAHALSQLGYEVVTPLLPGHQKDKKRMTRVQAEDWIKTVGTLVEEAISQKKIVHVIGFSMGALLAAIVAHRYPIRSLVLLSPAVLVATPAVWLTRSKQTLSLLLTNRALLQQTVRNNLFSLGSTPVSNLLQFQKVVRAAKQVIPHLTLPICLIHGLKDEIVDPRSSDWIYKTAPSKDKELYLLHHSGHLVCHDVEADLLVQEVIQFLSRHTPR